MPPPFNSQLSKEASYNSLTSTPASEPDSNMNITKDSDDDESKEKAKSDTKKEGRSDEETREEEFKNDNDDNHTDDDFNGKKVEHEKNCSDEDDDDIRNETTGTESGLGGSKSDEKAAQSHLPNLMTTKLWILTRTNQLTTHNRTGRLRLLTVSKKKNN